MPNDYSDLKAKVLARFAGHDYVPDGPVVFAWHIHHDVLAEPLCEPVSRRVMRLENAMKLLALVEQRAGSPEIVLEIIKSLIQKWASPRD